MQRGQRVIALGLASAAWSGSPVDAARAVQVRVGALAAHASVNMFNELHEHKSGLDGTTQRTPSSGGSGALPADPAALQATLIGASRLLVLTMGIGLWLMLRQGAALLPIGLAGVLLVVRGGLVVGGVIDRLQAATIGRC